MMSLSNIPEPSVAYRQVPPDDAPHALPITAGAAPRVSAKEATASRHAAAHDEPQIQIDNVVILMLLFIAGALLRIVLGVLGPMQGIGDERLLLAQAQGHSALTGEPVNAYPLFDLMVIGVSNSGVPAWLVVLAGSLLTLVAVPAAYCIGIVTTGRRIPGIVAAAIVAVHPAVLTLSNLLSGAALALGLLTIGLALVCRARQQGLGSAIGGGLLLGLAGLTAPLCWLAGCFAAPLVAKLAWQRGAGKAIGVGCCVMVLALGPVVGYRAAFFGHSADALLPEFVQTTADHTPLAPADRLLVAMTEPSFTALGEAMHLPLADAGRLHITRSHPPRPKQARDPIADLLADGWLLLNGALAGLAALSLGVMLVRRRIIEAAVLAAPLVALAFCTAAPTEVLRLPMIALLAVLSMGLLAKRPAALLTEAEREARQLAKLTKREEKERAKQQRQLDKQNTDLHAFDRLPRKDKPQPKRETTAVMGSRPI